ncbi:MAG: chromosome segregation protein SMC [Sarcina sp.]
MFLKSLEIRGFKSFADKTELKFTNGITAIVGPNGSGKSNVSDAVRWVLGEQSARTLRGSKMEDIIFTGTEYRKGIGIASVSLTLDNSDESLPIDFNEVKVTRRIYRSGESEYLINNTSCRLKDVVNLFMDTGIGKEGYSLIGQGKIDAILSGKSEDRRALLEEAAGIVKYKTRKNEAERKLKNTDENLMRINDIVYTYEERIEPLETEKKKAEKYLELTSELKQKDINLLINNLLRINNQIDEKKKTLEVLEEECNKEKKKNSISKETLKSLKLDLEKLEKEDANKKEIYSNKKDEISKAEYDIKLLEEKIRNSNGAINKAKKDLSFEYEKIESLKNEKINLENDITLKKEHEKSLNSDIETFNISLNELKVLSDKRKLEKENLKSKDLEAVKEEANYLNQKDIFNSKMQDFTTLIKEKNNKLESLGVTHKVNIATKMTLDKELREKDNIKESLFENKKVKLENVTKEEDMLKSYSLEFNKIISNITKNEASLDILQKLEQNHEGYNSCVKKLFIDIKANRLNVKANSAQILGDILSTKKGYELAIEISLGAAISNVITSDEFIAKKMIEYLKKNKLGRATFLPMAIIKGKKLSIMQELTKLNGYLGIASDLVEFKSEYENIINYVLGRTIICKDIDSALNFAKKSGYKYKIVTLDGEVVNSGGALTGGSINGRSAGIISRRVEIEELKEKIKLTKENKIDIESKIVEFEKAIAEKKALISKFDKKLHENELETLNIKNEIKRVESEIFNIKTMSKNITLEVEDINLKLENLIKDIEILEKKYSNFKNKGDGNKVLIKNLEDTITQFDVKISKLEGELTNKKIELASITEKIESNNRNIIRANSEFENIEINITRANKYIEDNINSNKISERKILDKKNLINFEKEKLSNMQEKSKEFEGFRAKLKEKIVKVEGEIESSILAIAKKDEEIHRHKITYTKHESEKENSMVRLVEEYSIDIDEAIDHSEVIEDVEKHKMNIYALKSKINALGTVNVNAIEEYKELIEKYRFLVTERADLENAKTELIGIIDEMISKMKVIFRQNFNILSNNFDITFKELFKGGSAKLILNDEDELSSDIEIRVQPPGKKIQNINLMSGGEKVLSAIALMFAILRMKPTPFCILDEIEAALDDVNVARYAEFLKGFTHDIQFIVITHRKGTMEVADVMYGVTMEEKGISKVVSVDLNKK